MKRNQRILKSCYALGMAFALFAHSNNVVGQAVDDPFQMASNNLNRETETNTLTLEGPALEHPVSIATHSFRQSEQQSQSQTNIPLRSVVEPSVQLPEFNPFLPRTSRSQETQFDVAPIDPIKPTTETEWRATEFSDTVPQLNAPEMSSPQQTTVPQLNVPQLNAPQLNAPNEIPNVQVPTPTMTSPRSLNYAPKPPIPSVWEDLSNWLDRRQAMGLSRSTGYLPYGGYESDNFNWRNYRNRSPQERYERPGLDWQSDTRGYDPRSFAPRSFAPRSYAPKGYEPRSFDPRYDPRREMYYARQPVILIPMDLPMDLAPNCPFGGRF